MKCPVDGETLVIADRNGVEIDYCPSCRGVWLDRGELDKIIERASAYAAPPPPPPAFLPPRALNRLRSSRAWAGSCCWYRPCLTPSGTATPEDSRKSRSPPRACSTTAAAKGPCELGSVIAGAWFLQDSG